MGATTIFNLLKEAYNDWSEDKASRLAAALAYYTVFSIAPLILIAISIAGFVFGEAAASGAVYGQLEGLMGPTAAEMLETAVQNSQKTDVGTFSAIIGIVLLVWSASNVFAQLQEALNTIWEVTPDPNAGVLSTVRRRVLSMTMVLGIGFMLLVSLVLSAVLSVLGNLFNSLLPGGEVVWQVVNFAVSFGVITLLFAAMYKIVPDAEVAWSDVWIGAGVTALLFTVGKLLIGLYLGYASVGSTFGAAGSLLVLLLWVYYSAQILFFGAEFTQVYARTYGSRIVPDEGAVPLTEEARAREGSPRKPIVQHAAATGLSAEEAARQPAVQPVVHAARNGPATNGRSGNGAVGAEHAAAVSRNGRKRSKRGPKSSGTMKSLMWVGLSSGSMALAGLVANKASAMVWKAVSNEPPPIKKS
jgi:membrane protein